MAFSFTFLETMLWGLYFISPVLLMLFSIIAFLGLVVSWIETWSLFDALYWACITALTVGYGDIRPQHKLSRLLSVIIAMLGIMFAGIIVAITVEATSAAFAQHVSAEVINTISGSY